MTRHHIFEQIPPSIRITDLINHSVQRVTDRGGGSIRLPAHECGKLTLLFGFLLTMI